MLTTDELHRNMAFISIVEEVGEMIHDTAKKKGFNYNDKPMQLGLIHSEVSEAFESLRHVTMPRDAHLPDYFALEMELADVVSRVLGFAHAHKLRVASAILAKAEYNKDRPFKHGGKLF